MPFDSEIACSARRLPIAELARDRLGAPDVAVIPYGRGMAKLALPWLEGLPDNPGARLAQLEHDGWGALPVCVAKTQYSFSTDPSLRGAPAGHVLRVRDLRVSAGAGFVVALAGDMQTMPGLPARPRAEGVRLAPDGTISGIERSVSLYADHRRHPC